MRKLLPLVLIAVGATALFAWTVTNRNGDADENGSPLAFAPADTPYAIGMDQPFPQAMAEDWVDRLDPAMPVYVAQLRQFARLAAMDGRRDAAGTDAGSDATDADADAADADAADDSAAAPGAAEAPDPATPAPTLVPRLLDALADEIEGRRTREVLAAAGLAPNSRMALYGIGLVPVLRWELADPDAFRALVARLEQKVGQSLPQAQLGEQPYWTLGADAAPLSAIAAIVGGHLVVTVAPATATPEALAVLLGLERPDPSLLDSDTLDALAGKYGYEPHLLGFFDSGRLLTALASDATPLEQAFLDALGLDKPQLSEVCRDEYQQLATLWPGGSFGYTRLEDTAMEVRAVLEAAPELARDLMTLRAPMPALAAVDADTAFNLGVSFNLDALPTLVNKRAAAVAAAPYQCASLAWLNAGATQAQAGINNPALFAMAPVFRGFHLIVEEFALDAQMHPTALSGALVIGSNNPQSLLAMAAMAVPQAASLKLTPDGSVHPLELPPLPAPAPEIPAWVSMTDTLLGIGFGAGGDARLPEYMESDPDRQPVLVMGYSGRLYATFADVMANAAPAFPDPQSREDMALQARMMREVYADWIAHAGLRVELTEHGIEMLQTITTND